ncbi:hypothetical protein AVDCRST_MAG92-1447 [uncultured Coleofasciculus sp.]|uniref:Uncharacterized protein n=1 Tax=uncultured Coleofasciculus sp. TaxID=1267456 RepID=A0A6J4I439_9CYAN|nr:hypothetical protein AVDCRST_MAG92-1447 [uncultured Coleofasciculus sp.]
MKRSQKLRNKEPEVTPTPEVVEPEDTEDDYFEQLQKRGKKLKNSNDETNL